MSNEQFYCTNCKRQTIHDLLHDELEKHIAEDGTCTWKVYELIRCFGCQNISFHFSDCRSRTSDPHSEVLSAKSEYYPNSRDCREPIEGVEKFPEVTQSIYKELLKVVHEDTRLLAAIGLRTLLESVCRDQSYTWRHLYEGIEDLSVYGILSFTQVEFLHACRFMGNVAAHEIVAPTMAELVAALDIAETLLKTIYILPEKAKSISSKRKE
jgi:Domain of unknown function (DUF4145)